MMMGLLTAGFSMGFHITCYVSDGHRFSFVGTLPRPFRKFVINNSLLPLLFLATHLYEVIAFQVNNENTSPGELVLHVLGFAVGYLLMTFLFSLYFRFTNKDIFKYMFCK